MDVVHSIIDAFGGVNAIAEATGTAQQTASEWKTRKPPEIPPWRRPLVAEAARRLDVALGADALAYLASRDRRPKAARPVSPDQQALVA